jgi:hypothetical protein
MSHVKLYRLPDNTKPVIEECLPSGHWSPVAWVPADRICELEAALRDIEPYLDALICYASTIDEHLPNGFPARVRAVLAGSPSSDEVEHISEKKA